MRSVVWSPDALEEFDQAVGYIAQDNPYAARRVAAAISATAQGLALMPTGRRGRVTGIYEKVVTRLPYIIAYALMPKSGKAEDIYILRIIHTARDWPPEQWPE